MHTCMYRDLGMHRVHMDANPHMYIHTDTHAHTPTCVAHGTHTHAYHMCTYIYTQIYNSHGRVHPQTHTHDLNTHTSSAPKP